jgi:hypothetical protein
MSAVDFPALTDRHVEGARLFANRRDLIAGLPIPAGAVVAEVGVAAGDFSQFLLDQLSPSRFVAIDNFMMDQLPFAWDTPIEMYFDGLSHIEYYRRRFANYGSLVEIQRGESYECLARYRGPRLDLIYIDACHYYDTVKRDIESAAPLLKDTGILVLNDYTLTDEHGTTYGVIPAVNEFIVDSGWRVLGFALDKSMFCDIAIHSAA